MIRLNINFMAANYKHDAYKRKEAYKITKN